MKYDEIITYFYLKYNPEKKDDVKFLLEKYKGEENLLIERMCKKYNVQLESFLQDFNHYRKMNEVGLGLENNNQTDYYNPFTENKGKGKNILIGFSVAIVYSLIVLILLFHSGRNHNNTPKSDNDGLVATKNDASQIKELIIAWSKLDPSMAGGPYELQGLSQIIQIVVKNIRMNEGFGKEADALLIFSTSGGKIKHTNYDLVTLEGDWGILSINKRGVYPIITLNIIEARRNLKTTMSTKD